MLEEKLIYWINEREKVRVRKEASAPKPWSDDPIFHHVYFCNVHREDDRVTKWIRETYNPWCDDAMFVPNIMLARLVNKIESLDYFGYMKDGFYEPGFRKAESMLSPFWGSAYVVTTHGRRMKKVDYAVEIMEAAFNHPPDLSRCPHLFLAHEKIMDYEGFASFMAAQVVADLKNTPGHALADAPDWWTWSAPGPGSLRGLGWVYGHRVTHTSYNHYIKLLWINIGDHVPEMSMQDLQNCLCEFDKYCRVQSGTGRSKRRYNGHG